MNKMIQKSLSKFYELKRDTSQNKVLDMENSLKDN